MLKAADRTDTLDVAVDWAAAGTVVAANRVRERTTNRSEFCPGVGRFSMASSLKGEKACNKIGVFCTIATGGGV